LVVLEELSAQDLVPQEHRHLPGDVLRDGVLLAAGVRLRQPSRTTKAGDRRKDGAEEPRHCDLEDLVEVIGQRRARAAD